MMSTGRILLPLTCLALLSAAVVFISPEMLRQENVPAIAVTPPEVEIVRVTPEADAPGSQPPPKLTAVADPHVNPSPKSTEPKIARDTAGASPSSWQDPFASDLWDASGWTFTPQSMRPAGIGPASATFLRHYHKLMFECDILGAEEPGSTFELQLATRNAQVVMSLILSDGRLSVVATENGLAQVVIEKPLTVPLSNKTARQLRVVATGNRIVISWDHKRFLTTEQLAAQSGREIVWSIHTAGAAYQITQLRVEGD